MIPEVQMYGQRPYRGVKCFSFEAFLTEMYPDTQKRLLNRQANKQKAIHGINGPLTTPHIKQKCYFQNAWDWVFLSNETFRQEQRAAEPDGRRLNYRQTFSLLQEKPVSSRTREQAKLTLSSQHGLGTRIILGAFKNSGAGTSVLEMLIWLVYAQMIQSFHCHPVDPNVDPE